MSAENNPSSSGPVLPEKPKKKNTALWVVIAVLAVAAIVAAVLLVPSLFRSESGNEPEGAPEEGAAAEVERTTVTLGTTDASQGHWAVLQELLAEEGIDLEIVAFDSYETPNPALADGEIDLNAFQHIDYLSDHNVATGDDLRVVGPTLIVPLPIYSDKFADVEEIPDGSQIAIPQDATNQARALRVLEAAGLIELGDAEIPTPLDITSGRVEVVAVDASQTAPALNDPAIAAAVVNNNFATDAGILDKAIFEVDPSNLTEGDRPYVNVIASRPGEEDNPLFVKVWELYHDPRVTEIVVAESGDTASIVDVEPATVRQWLADAEAQKSAQ